MFYRRRGVENCNQVIMKAEIVIITYNNEEHISATIHSVKQQTLYDWNAIIVDNGSSDKTYSLAEKLILGDTRFALYTKSNEGPSAARNYGFSKTQIGIEYIHFLDGDDMLHPEFLSAMTSYMDRNPQVGLLGCQFDLLDKDGIFVRPGFRSRYCSGILGFPQKISDNINKTPFETFFAATGQGAFALFRKSVFEQTDGYEKQFWSHEDSDIFCQMALKAEVHYLPLRLYKVRRRKFSLRNSPKKNYDFFRNKWDFYKSSNTEVNILIEDSLKYYYTRHKPLRDFKVALKAFKYAFAAMDRHSFKWSMDCFYAGITDLFMNKTYKNRMIERQKEELNC